MDPVTAFIIGSAPYIDFAAGILAFVMAGIGLWHCFFRKPRDGGGGSVRSPFFVALEPEDLPP